MWHSHRRVDKPWPHSYSPSPTSLGGHLPDVHPTGPLCSWWPMSQELSCLHSAGLLPSQWCLWAHLHCCVWLSHSYTNQNRTERKITSRNQSTAYLQKENYRKAVITNVCTANRPSKGRKPKLTEGTWMTDLNILPSETSGSIENFM